MRQSIGDYDTSTIIENSEYPLLAWILWGIIMVVGNIVFMNFIIAVVSESYSTNMQKMNQESYYYRAKLDMIIECE
jgi:hypothetical protein